MFLPLSEKIDSNKIINNYGLIKKDYQWAVENDVWFDYTHDIDITKDIDTTLLTRTEHFWTAVPLILKYKPIPFIPDELKNSFTVNLLMSLKVKPVLAVFSMLAPYSDIDPHIDTDDEIVLDTKDIPWHERDSSVVKYHMGIDVHNDGEACLVVGNEKRQVEEGNLLAFDETVTHYAYNHTSAERGVLIVSYLREDLYDN